MNSCRVCLEIKLPQAKKKRRKSKGLAQATAQPTNRTTSLSEIVHDTILETAMEDTGALKQGGVTTIIPSTKVPTVVVQNGHTQQVVFQKDLLLTEAEVEEEDLFTEIVVAIQKGMSG